MSRTYKTIGILGGMGPEASSTLYARMIKYIQTRFGAEQDTDYPPIVIYSLPLSGFDETGITDEQLVSHQLIEGVKKLEMAGSDLVIIACNTVHLFYDQMQNAVNIPVFNIIEETKKRVAEAGINKVGLFASETTGRLSLYQNNFSDSGIKVFSPDRSQQNALNLVIRHVMSGSQGEEDREVLIQIARNFRKKGAEAVVMGCTEIPLALNQSHTDIRLFDTIEIIIESAVNYSMME